MSQEILIQYGYTELNFALEDCMDASTIIMVRQYVGSSYHLHQRLAINTRGPVFIEVVGNYQTGGS